MALPAQTHAPTQCCPTCGHNPHYLIDDDACSTDTEDDYEAYQVDADVARLPPQDQLEEAYFKYRKAKQTWRKLAGRPTRKFRRTRQLCRRYYGQEVPAAFLTEPFWHGTVGQEEPEGQEWRDYAVPRLRVRRPSQA